MGGSLEARRLVHDRPDASMVAVGENTRFKQLTLDTNSTRYYPVVDVHDGKRVPASRQGEMGVSSSVKTLTASKPVLVFNRAYRRCLKKNENMKHLRVATMRR